MWIHMENFAIEISLQYNCWLETVRVFSKLELILLGLGGPGVKHSQLTTFGWKGNQ